MFEILIPRGKNRPSRENCGGLRCFLLQTIRATWNGVDLAVDGFATLFRD